MLVGCATAQGHPAGRLRPLNRFLWGVATSGHQTEGDDESSQWHVWESQGHTSQANPIADDSYRKWREDLDLAASMHLSAYRFSIEWSRVEPEPGRFDPRAIAHYLRIARGARARGMTPIITLFHFAYPAWLDRPDAQGRRGWERPDAADRFAWYVDKVVPAFGSTHPLWLTINEPTVFTYYGYVKGVWPPGKQDPHDAWIVLSHLLEAHAEAYRVIHAHFPDAWVSFNNMALDFKLFPAAESYAVARGRTTGAEPTGGFGRNWSFEPDLWLLTFIHPKLRQEMDYTALDYYFPMVAGQEPSLHPWFWPVYPQGLYEAIRDYHEFFHLPVLVAENGIAMHDDSGRPDGWTREAFLAAHVQQVMRARAAGIPVLGYCYWSLLDNYEWGSFLPRFGLFHVDYEDPGLARIPTPAVAYYKDIAEHDGLTERLARMILAERRAARPVAPGTLLAEERQDDAPQPSAASPIPVSTPPAVSTPLLVATPLPLSTPFPMATPPRPALAPPPVPRGKP